MPPRQLSIPHIWPYIAVCALLASASVQIVHAGPDPVTDQSESTILNPTSTPVRLPKVPDDALFAREKQKDNPLLTASELAKLTPLFPYHHRLIKWMYEDLVKYEKNHKDIWDQRRKQDPVGTCTLECDRNQVQSSIKEFAEIIGLEKHDFENESDQSVTEFPNIEQGLKDLHVSDFHTLVSIFVTPDSKPETNRRKAFILTERWPGCAWPTEAFLYTNKNIGFRTMAMTFGLHIHYLGLISHLDLNAAPHGKPMIPQDFLGHDFGHALAIYNSVRGTRDTSKSVANSLSGKEYWPSIHQAFADMRDANGRTPQQQQMDDIVYFFLLHELECPQMGNRGQPTLFDYISSSRSFLAKAAGTDDFAVICEMLQDSVDRVVQFHKKHLDHVADKPEKLWSRNR